MSSVGRCRLPLWIAAALLCLAAGSALEGPAPRHDRWRILGPGGGGAQFGPAVSPHDPNLVFVACDMSGSYVSTDGGDSWREFNLRGAIRSFAFDPKEPRTVYAAGSFLWRSDDRGDTWNLVYPVPETVKAVTFPGDDEAVTTMMTTHGSSPAVEAFDVDPQDGRMLYLCAGRSLLISRNRGRTWEAVAKLHGAARRIHFAGQRKLFLVGANWTGMWDARKLVNSGPVAGISRIRASAVSLPGGERQPTLYLVADFQDRSGSLSGGLLESRDDGQTWKAASGALLAMRQPDSKIYPYLSAIAIPAALSSTIYLSFSRLALRDGRTVFGLAKSVDGAKSWELVWQQTDTPSPKIADAWVSETFGPEWPEDTQGLAIQPDNPDVVYETDLARTMRSRDGGRTWTALYSRTTQDGRYISTGIDVTNCYGIHFDPLHPRRQFLSCTDIGLFRSEDGGASWESSGKGIPRAWRNTTYWVAPDPKVEGRMWAACSGSHDLPRFKMFRRVSPAAFKGGVVMTGDGGKNWKASNSGMPETAITHLLVDPASPADRRVLYAASMGRGVYKSTDGGATWNPKNNGLAAVEPLAWRFAMDSTRALYLVVIRRSEDGGYGNDRDGMLYRSIDGAENWERLPLPPGVNGPVGVTVDPGDPKRIYVAAWPRYNASVVNPPQQGGLWLSADGGRTWRNTLSADQYLYDVTVDPRDPSVVFAAGFQSSIWRSEDRGETWRRIRGFNFKCAYRVIPDPLDPEMIYVPTYGSSIWHGPAKGDPEAAEDIVLPPVARYSR